MVSLPCCVRLRPNVLFHDPKQADDEICAVTCKYSDVTYAQRAMQKLLRPEFDKCHYSRLPHLRTLLLASVTTTQDEGSVCGNCQWEGDTPDTHIGASVEDSRGFPDRAMSIKSSLIRSWTVAMSLYVGCA